MLGGWWRTSDGQLHFSAFNEILMVSLMYHYEVVKIEYMNVYRTFCRGSNVKNTFHVDILHVAKVIDPVL